MIRSIAISVFFILLFVQPVYPQGNSGSDSAEDFKEDTVRYFILPLNLNSTRSEYCPVIVNRNLIFSSDRGDKWPVTYINENANEPVDLYISERVDSVNFKPAQSFSRLINTAFNDGPATFDRTGEIMIFSSNSLYKFDIKGNGTSQKNLQLYVSSKTGSGWSMPVKLPFCSPEFSYTHPSLSADGKKLFFSSNEKNGFGEMDLYYTVAENNSWTAPLNAGAGINSPGNDVFPFISEDDILYYSSNKKSGYGGLDIYSCDLKGPKPYNPHILEIPLNSPSDDFGIYMYPGAEQGYLSSNRSSSSKDDIYYFSDKYSGFKNCRELIRPSYCFKFSEESSTSLLEGNDSTSLIYEWVLGDGTKKRGLEAKHCYGKPGQYDIELNIIESKSGALFYNEASYQLIVSDSEQVYINCPDTIIVNQAFNINSSNSRIPGVSILKYTWNFGDGNYSSGITGLKKYSKTGNFTIQLSALLKNDSSGILSTVCVGKNIFVAGKQWKSSGNLTYSAPSDKKNIYSSDNIDSLNFRVFLGSSEHDIPENAIIFDGLTDIKQFEKDSIYIYTAGHNNKLSQLESEYAKAQEKGFTNASVIGLSGDSILQSKKLVGRKINDTLLRFSVVKDVFFDFNKHTVNESYYSVLDSIINDLKENPSLKISLYAFSDTVGDHNYNLKLSEARAGSVRKYFLKKGVRKDRIKNIPMGEQLPEDERKKNGYIVSARKVTIYLTKQ